MARTLLDAAPAVEAPTPALTPAWRLALPGMALATVAALVGLDRHSLWLDESLSLGATNQLIETWRGTSGTMAAYYLVLDGWTSVASSVWWIRLLSVACIVTALLPLASLARRIGGDALAARACVVAGLLPVATRYAQEARSYALVVLLVTTATWCVVRAVEAEVAGRPARPWWRLTTVLGVLLVLSHGLTVVNLAALGALVALAPAPVRATCVRRYLPTVGAALAVTAVLWTAGADEVGAWVAPLDLDQVRTVVETYTSTRWWAALVVVALLVAGAVLLGRTARDADADPLDRFRALVPAVWVVVPPVALVALSVVRPSLVDRYLIGIVPGLALLVGRAWVALDRRSPRLGGLGLGALAVAAVLVVGQVDVHDRTGDDWRGAAAVVAADARPGDGVLFPRTYHRTPFEAAWREVPAAAPEPTLVDTVRPLGTPRRHDPPLAPDEVAERLAGLDRVWLVTADEPGSRGDPLGDLVADRADRFAVAERVDLGGSVRVVLLERR